MLSKHAAESGCLLASGLGGCRPPRCSFPQGLGAYRTSARCPSQAVLPGGRSVCPSTARPRVPVCLRGGGRGTKRCDGLFSRGAFQPPPPSAGRARGTTFGPSTWTQRFAPHRPHLESPPAAGDWPEALGGQTASEALSTGVALPVKPGSCPFPAADTKLVAAGIHRASAAGMLIRDRDAGINGHSGRQLESFQRGGRVPLPSCHAHPGDPPAKRRRGWRALPSLSFLLIYCNHLLPFLPCIQEGDK